MGTRIPFDYYDRLVILELWGCRCAYCGTRLAQGEDDCDHVVPWSLDGEHALSNVASACAACNRRKGGQTAAAFGHAHVHDEAKALARIVYAAVHGDDEYVLGVDVTLVRKMRLVRAGWVLRGPTRADR